MIYLHESDGVCGGGITPSEVPPPPPPSATKSQLALFSRVLTRCTNQLKLLQLENLGIVYSFLSEDISEIVSQKWPTDMNTQDDFIAFIRYLLVGYFHTSIDTRVKPNDRQHALNKVKHIFWCLDQGMEWTGQPKELVYPYRQS